MFQLLIYTLEKVICMNLLAENIHNPTSYDELERFINTYNPNETIIISNMDEKKINEV